MLRVVYLHLAAYRREPHERMRTYTAFLFLFRLIVRGQDTTRVHARTCRGDHMEIDGQSLEADWQRGQPSSDFTMNGNRRRSSDIPKSDPDLTQGQQSRSERNYTIHPDSIVN